jgi:hypothetical protein
MSEPTPQQAAPESTPPPVQEEAKNPSNTPQSADPRASVTPRTLDYSRDRQGGEEVERGREVENGRPE